MRHLWAVALAVALVAGGWSTSAYADVVSENTSGLLHVLEVEPTVCTFDDSVQICYSVTNVTDEPITICLWYNLCPVWVYVYDPTNDLVWGDPEGCFCSAGPKTLQPGESFVRDPLWGMCTYFCEDYVDMPGVYRVESELTSMDPEYYTRLQMPLLIVDSLTDVAEFGATVPKTWGRLKALYR